MLRILTLVSIVFLATLFGCKDEECETFVCQLEQTHPCGIDSNHVNFRIVNVSSYDYCNVKVRGDGMFKNYGEILIGDTTCYISFMQLSSINPSIHLIFEGDTAGLSPGEYIPVNLPNGFYTCKLDLTPVFIDTMLQQRHGNLDMEILPD